MRKENGKMNVGFKSYATINNRNTPFRNERELKTAIMTRLGENHKGVDCYDDRTDNNVIVNHDNTAFFERTVLPVLCEVAGEDDVDYDPNDNINDEYAKMHIESGMWKKIR
jgi:hypothetical protein